MRSALVAGFFGPVEEAVRKEFPLEFKRGTVIWIPQRGPLQPPDLQVFNSRFFGCLEQGSKDALILLAVLRGKEWVKDKVEQSIEQANLRFEHSKIDLLTSRNAQDVSYVLGKLREFKPSQAVQLSAEAMRKKIGSAKILCIRGKQNTDFRRAVERDGFFEGAFDEFFEEDVLEYDSHPDTIKKRIGSFGIVLCAYSGLSHKTVSGLDGHSGTIFKKALSRECVIQLRKHILDEE